MAKPKPSSPTPDFGAAITRLREIAANSADRLLLADGPPHPDAELLDLCAEIKPEATNSPEWISSTELSEARYRSRPHD